MATIQPPSPRRTSAQICVSATADRYPGHEITPLRRFRRMSSDRMTDRLLIDMIKTCGKGKEATFWSVVAFGKLCVSRS